MHPYIYISYQANGFHPWRSRAFVHYSEGFEARHRIAVALEGVRFLASEAVRIARVFVTKFE